jgi:ABC-type transport system involved in multi-copper enzyme maturation permease subunit
MTVFARTLGPYDGPLVPRNRRFLVIWRSSRRQVFASRILTAFYALSFAPILVAMIYVYLRYNLPVLETFQISAANLPAADGRYFFNLLRLQGIFAFLIAAFIGPGLIAPDLADNGLALYLARPITRTGYVLGKLMVLAILLSAMTWVPLAGLWGLAEALDPAALAGSDLRTLVAIVAGSALWIALISLLSLAVSAWVRWKLIAAALLFAFFFISRGMGALLNVQFETRWGDVVSPGKLIVTVWEGLFFGSATGVPQLVAWLLLTALAGLGVLLLHKKLRAYEVVR